MRHRSRGHWTGGRGRLPQLRELNLQSWTATAVWGLKERSCTATAVWATERAALEDHCGPW